MICHDSLRKAADASLSFQTVEFPEKSGFTKTDSAGRWKSESKTLNQTEDLRFLEAEKRG